MVLEMKDISRTKLKNEDLQSFRTSLENLQEDVLQEERRQERKKGGTEEKRESKEQ